MTDLRRGFRQLARLSAAERTWLLEALFLLPISAAALRAVGLDRVRSAVIRLGRRARPRLSASRDPIERATDVARMVQIASRHGFPRTACLERSIVIWTLLRREGIPGDLRIGVRKHDEGLAAHAWVELDGTPLNETSSVYESFAPFGDAILPREPGAG